MDFLSFYRLRKRADHVVTTTFQLPAGVIMATAVSLYRITEEGLEGEEVTWTVTRAGNPEVVVLHTEDEAAAHRAYADEIDQARKAQSERTMWRR